MLSSTNSATLLGVSALPVAVEANSGERGDPRVVLVGLPDATVKESLDRVHSSLSNGGFSLPRTRITVNLAPADLRVNIKFAVSFVTCIHAPIFNPSRGFV